MTSKYDAFIWATQLDSRNRRWLTEKKSINTSSTTGIAVSHERASRHAFRVK